MDFSSKKLKKDAALLSRSLLHVVFWVLGACILQKKKGPFFSSMFGDFFVCCVLFVFRKVEIKMKMVAKAADFSFCSR